MTSAAHRPDLCHVAQCAFQEVVETLLSMPSTVPDASSRRRLSDAPDQIGSSVPLAGPRLSGSVHLRLPQAFVTCAIQVLTGRHDPAGETSALVDDAAGELANMVAGRVAARLAADGYPCGLGTPSVSRSPNRPIEAESGGESGRTDLICEGHWLSLEVRCRFASV